MILQECLCPIRLSNVDDCIAYFGCHGLKPLDGATCENTSSVLELTSLVWRGVFSCFTTLIGIIFHVQGFKSWEDLLDQETIEVCMNMYIYMAVIVNV